MTRRSKPAEGTALASLPRGLINAEGSHHGSTERIERIQTLEPGVYWRAIVDAELPDPHFEGHTITIESGTVLLLVDVRHVDGEPHTVVFRHHPLDGDGEYRVLIDQMIRDFEPAADGEQVRQREMLSLQKEISDLQTELQDAQQNPALMAPEVDKRYQEWEAETNRKTRAGKKRVRTSTRTALAAPGARLETNVSSIVAQGITDEHVIQIQRLAEREAKLAELRANWITERTGAMATKLAALAPFYVEKSAVALARTSAMRRFAEDIMKGLASLDLYTGKGVEVETLVKGASAPANEKLSLRQAKLLMDEELAAWANVGATFDFRNVATFDKAIAEQPSLRDQIFPTPRCVVSMAIRRSDLDYGDGWSNVRCNEINRSVFLLVRDGENIYRVFSAQPTHEAAERLFPTRNEFGELFSGVDGSRISLRDVRYTDRLELADKLALHYKRFLILLCGLDHRLQLFGRFYDQAAAMSFISMGFQREYMQFLADDEPTLLGDGRPQVFAWIAEKNSYLQSGSRVMCYYPVLITPNTAPACQKIHNWRGRDDVRVYAEPKQRFETLIAYRDSGDLCVDVRVVRENTWREITRPEFDAQVNLSKSQARGGELGFLCLDAVAPEELDRYIHSREARIHHVEYIRIFKETAEVLRKERAVESPARQYLCNAAVQAGLASSADVGALVNDAVRAWRCANRGRPLPAATDFEALTPILNYMHSIRHSVDDRLQRVERFVATKGFVPLKVVLTGKNRLAVYVEVPPERRDERLVQWRWVERIGLTLTKDAVSETNRSLAWLTETPTAKETALHRWPETDAWINKDPEPPRPTRLCTALDFLDKALPRAVGVFLASGEGIPDEVFDSMLRSFRRLLHGGRRRYVGTYYLSIPFGVYVEQDRNRRSRIVYLVIQEQVQAWLYRFGNANQRSRVEEVFTGIYQNKESAQKRLRAPFSPSVAVQYRESDDFYWMGDQSESTRHVREALHYRRDGKPLDRSRPLNGFVCEWVDRRQASEKNHRDSGPARFVLHPLAWDGERASLERFFHGVKRSRQ